MSERISLTRDRYLDSLRQLSSTAKELGGRYTLTQLTWQPGAGERWSILECLDHLVLTTGLLLSAMEPAIGDARSGADSALFRTAGFLSTKVVRDAEPPPRNKLWAPPKLAPRPTLHPEGILPEFLKTMDRVSVLVTASAAKDLNSVRFRAPLVPLLRFTVASGFLLIAAHSRRHLWQADQVIQDPDFPG